MRRSLLIFPAVALGCLFASGEARADTFLNLRVPAAACRPKTTADAGKVVLVNGVYKLRDTLTGGGTATLECPVHFQQYSSIALLAMNIGSIRVWYKDPDGTGLGTRLQTTLMRRARTSTAASAVAGSNFDSNAPGLGSSFQRLAFGVSHTCDYRDASYHVEVVLTGDGTSTPLLSGVDFTVGIS